jgi:choline/carnitine/betaine transport
MEQTSTSVPPAPVEALSDAPSPASRPQRVGSVFWISLGLIAAFVVWAAAFTENLNATMTAAQNWVTGSVGWGYLVVTLGLIGLLVYIMFSRYGALRLGPSDSRPDYPTYAWLAMILSAVMGVGLISYGVAEPISHFIAPPPGLAESGSRDAAVRAMQFSFFDWGIHAWAVFAIFGLAIGYSTHRLKRSALVSTMLRPILGKAADGWVGKTVDVLVIIATLFGTTTSLGLGAAQIDNGMASVFGLTGGTATRISIIAIITVLFTASALSGVHRGIRYISQTTMVLAVGLLLFVLVTGPTNFITNLFVESIGRYANDFISMSLITPHSDSELQWMQWWTYFMMAWWIAWGAFVGVFLAKISRGRTIRQFIIGVLGVPSLVFFIWFTVFGGTAIHSDMTGDGAIGKAATADVNSAFFAMLAELPLTSITSTITIILVVLFFVSGADANTYVLSMLSSKGVLTPKRPVLVVWGAITGITAIVLLLAGGLAALQQAVILSAAPFTVIVVLLAVSLMIELRRDPEILAMGPLKNLETPAPTTRNEEGEK